MCVCIILIKSIGSNISKLFRSQSLNAVTFLLKIRI